MIRLALLLLALYLLNETGWRLYAWFGTSQPRGLSPRDGVLPENILPPRSRWEYFATRTSPGVYFRIKRRTRQAALEHVSAPYVVKWRSWQLDAVALTWHVHLSRWSERWAS